MTPWGSGTVPLGSGQKMACSFLRGFRKSTPLLRKGCINCIRLREKKIEVKHPPFSLSVGDAVWVRNLPVESKIDRLWQGPCEVLQVINGTTIRIDTSDGVQMMPASRLKYYVAPQGKREPYYFYRKRHNPRATEEEDEWVLDGVLKVH